MAALRSAADQRHGYGWVAARQCALGEIEGHPHVSAPHRPPEPPRRPQPLPHRSIPPPPPPPPPRAARPGGTAPPAVAVATTVAGGEWSRLFPILLELLFLCVRERVIAQLAALVGWDAVPTISQGSRKISSWVGCGHSTRSFRLSLLIHQPAPVPSHGSFQIHGPAVQDSGGMMPGPALRSDDAVIS